MKIFLSFCILFLSIECLFAQDIVHKKLFGLYNEQKVEELRDALKALENKNTLEVQFLNSLFLEDGEAALKVYLYIFENSFGELKSIVAEKVSDYYYAKGYYLTASKYQKYMVENTKSVSGSNATENNNQVKYIIQLGAFGLKDNALQLQEMLQTQNLFTRIEKREINDKVLHCVWLDGKEGFSETLEFAEKIKEKYHLQYRILQQ